MIEVIRKGSLKRVECNSCGSVLRYDANEDVCKTELPTIDKKGTYVKEYIKCPVCKEEIVLSGLVK